MSRRVTRHSAPKVRRNDVTAQFDREVRQVAAALIGSNIEAVAKNIQEGKGKDCFKVTVKVKDDKGQEQTQDVDLFEHATELTAARYGRKAKILKDWVRTKAGGWRTEAEKAEGVTPQDKLVKEVIVSDVLRRIGVQTDAPNKAIVRGHNLVDGTSETPPKPEDTKTWGEPDKPAEEAAAAREATRKARFEKLRAANPGVDDKRLQEAQKNLEADKEYRYIVRTPDEKFDANSGNNHWYYSRAKRVDGKFKEVVDEDTSFWSRDGYVPEFIEKQTKGQDGKLTNGPVLQYDKDGNHIVVAENIGEFKKLQESVAKEKDAEAKSKEPSTSKADEAGKEAGRVGTASASTKLPASDPNLVESDPKAVEARKAAEETTRQNQGAAPPPQTPAQAPAQTPSQDAASATDLKPVADKRAALQQKFKEPSQGIIMAITVYDANKKPKGTTAMRLKADAQSEGGVKAEKLSDNEIKQLKDDGIDLYQTVQGDKDLGVSAVIGQKAYPFAANEEELIKVLSGAQLSHLEEAKKIEEEIEEIKRKARDRFKANNRKIEILQVTESKVNKAVKEAQEAAQADGEAAITFKGQERMLTDNPEDKNTFLSDPSDTDQKAFLIEVVEDKCESQDQKVVEQCQSKGVIDTKGRPVFDTVDQLWDYVNEKK